MRYFPALVTLFLSGCSAPAPPSVFVTCEGNEDKYEGRVIGLDAAGKSNKFKKIFWVDRASGTVSELLEVVAIWNKCSQSCQASVQGNLVIIRTEDDHDNGSIRFTTDETIEVNLDRLSISGDGHQTMEFRDPTISNNDYRYRLTGTCRLSGKNPSQVELPHE